MPVVEVYDWLGEKMSMSVHITKACMHSFIYMILEKLRNSYLRIVCALPMRTLLFESAIVIV